MVTKKELLEFAAKVYANPDLKYCPVWKCMAIQDNDTGYYKWGSAWNSLTDSDCALDLVTRLGLCVIAREDCVIVSDTTGEFTVNIYYNDEGISSANEATRLAVTRCAAEVMKRSKVLSQA